MSSKQRQKRAGGRTAVRPFESNLEYLVATLEYLGALASRRIVEQALDESGRDGRLRQDVDELGLPIDRPGLKRQARRLGTEVERKHSVLQRRTERTLEAGGVELGLERLARLNGLSEFEKLALAVIIGPRVDNGFRRLLISLSHGHDEVRTVLDLLCEDLEEKIRARRCFTAGSRLVANGLICMAHPCGPGAENEFLMMSLDVPRRIAGVILGEYEIDDQLVGFASVIEPQVELDQVVLPAGRKEEVLRLLQNREEWRQQWRAWGLERVMRYGTGMVLLFCGPSGTGKTYLAHGLAKASGHRLMLVDAGKVIAYSPNSFEENLRAIFQEARLQNAILFFDEAEELFSDRSCNGLMPTLLREVEKLEGVCILATNRGQVLDEAMQRRIVYRLDFARPSPELREEIWRKHLPPELPLEEGVDVKALAEEFDFPGGFIKNAVLVGAQWAMQRPEGGGIRQEDLRRAAMAQLRGNLEEHAGRVVPRASLEDLVLDGETRQGVLDVIAAARCRSVVFSSWGFGRTSSMGRALSVLFCGESGVGKTITAEAIARELGAGLYRVRLPAIVSPYVGQTEKNIDVLFQEATAARAVLLFDEADSLFAMRLGEGSEHARYLNREINVLLTAMEEFDGMVILTTNRPEALDRAFERRIRFKVRFPRPDARAREKLWRRMLPAEAPVDGVDCAALARRYDFAGGAIRSAALRAAFKAAANGRVITQELLEGCAEEESQCEGAQFGFVGVRR